MAGRVLFPNGFTTDDLVITYEKLASVILPHLADRPLVLRRYPDTIRDESFWEKDAPSFTPKWVQRLPSPRKSGGPDIEYIGIPNVKTLRWAASIGCIEIHSFLHKHGRRSEPMLIAFDLDPGDGMGLVECCEVAQAIRMWFDKYGLQCFPKVSGSKGLQVYLPLNSPASYAVTQALARSVAEELERSDERITAKMARAERAGKVFIDWSQNAEHKTTVSVYSVRAKHPEPFVSIPLRWAEVEDVIRDSTADDLWFTPERAIDRVRKFGDLFAPVLTMKQEIPRGLITNLRIATSGQQIRRAPDRKVTASDLSLPKSSGQGGRKLFVVHHKHDCLEFAIEEEGVFRAFVLKAFPELRNHSVALHDAEPRPLSYLTMETAKSGAISDLGTYEVEEGSFRRGRLTVFLSGRHLSGRWILDHSCEGAILTNAGGSGAGALRRKQSALPQRRA